jgi:hypothetical protein
MRTTSLWARIIGTLILLSIIISGCKPTSTPEPTPTEVSPAATDTPLPPTPSETPMPPSEIPSPVPPTPTLTLTASETPSPPPSLTPTPSLTEELASLRVDGNAICYLGPGLVYDVRAYFVEGDTALLDGRLEDQSWWRMILPRDEEVSCWIQADLVTVSGSVSSLPVLTPPPTPTLSPTPTPGTRGVRFYMMVLDTGGPFGCGDSMVYFYTDEPVKGTFEEEVEAAMNALFSIQSEYYFGYYNPVYRSSLRAHEVIMGSNGEVHIKLSGKFAKPRSKCEAQRIRDQVWETAEQFPEIRHAVIWVNNALLGDLLMDIKE